MAKKRTPKLSDLLNAININEVIYVDDIFGNTHQVEPFIGLIEANIEEYKAKFKRFSHIFNVDNPSEIRNREIRSFWDNNLTHERLKVYDDLKEIIPEDVNDIIGDDDTNTIGDLYRSLPGFKLRCLAPNEWDREKKDILAKSTNDFFCIFDQELKEGRKGINLLEEAVGLNENLLCCILTNEILISGEDAYREELAASSTIKYDNLITLAKERAKSSNYSIADGIKKALLTNNWSKIKERTLNIIQKAFSKTSDEIKDKFDSFIFDDVILKSSSTEGVSEGETIFRLSNILYQNYAKQECINSDYYSFLTKEVDEARIINGFNFNKKSPEYAFELRHLELFEEKEILNNLYSPLRNGDIFKIKDDYFVLLGQPCDLMEREDRERNSSVATLLKMDIHSLKDYKKEKNDHSFPLFYFEKSTSKIAFVRFKERYFIDFDIIDLAVFNEEGRCFINIEKQKCPASLHLPWQNKFNYLKERYSTRVENLTLLLSSIESITEEGKKKLLKHFIFPSPSLPDLGMKKDYYDGKSEFDFEIKRVSHLKEPRSGLLLKLFNRYLSREGELHDFVSNLAEGKN